MINIGMSRIISLDPSINNAGVCTAAIECDYTGRKIRYLDYKLLRSSDNMNVHEKIVAIGGMFCDIVKSSRSKFIVFEIPSITAYGAGSRAYVTKRLEGIRKVAMLLYFIYGRLHNNGFYFQELEPSQWQDRSGIKKCDGDSKLWSIQKATEIVGGSIEDHNIADAICLIDFTFNKIINR